MKTFKLLSIFSLLVLLLFASACGPKEHEHKFVNDVCECGEINWANKIADYIEVVEATTAVAYEYDEFELSMIKIKVYYTDGNEREIPLSSDMLNDKDLEKLSKVGQPRVEVTYQACEPIKFTVKLIDSAMLDQNLNEKGEYGAVIKAIRKENKIEFILEPNGNACAFQFKYTFDNSIMQVSNAVQGNASGVYSINLENGSITAMIVLDETLSKETVLFTVDFTGNFRTSKLAVDAVFANKCYTKLDNYQTEEIEKVLYHASVK